MKDALLVSSLIEGLRLGSRGRCADLVFHQSELGYFFYVLGVLDGFEMDYYHYWVSEVTYSLRNFHYGECFILYKCVGSRGHRGSTLEFWGIYIHLHRIKHFQNKNGLFRITKVKLSY